LASGSVQSIDSILDDDGEDYYNNSILMSTQIKEPEDLIDKDLINLLSYIKRLQRPTDAMIEAKSLEFGEIVRHKTLIFDLDETLIHSAVIHPGQDHDILQDFEITLPCGGKFAVSIRPFVQKCLEHLSQYYEMAIFTASEQSYADLIINRLDPENKLFSHRLYRQHCIKIDDVYVKDLRIISDRNLEDLLIVDNSILAFACQLDNGIPICGFFSNNPADQELLYLITYLEEVYHQNDCRVANKKTFKLEDMMSKVP
jgi:CTD small phosphatase-like protein 2